MVIQVTPIALKQISKIIKPGKVIKICVTSGGCSGFQWNMNFIEPKEVHKNDEVVHKVLVVDRHSVFHLLGSVLDFSSSLKATEFTISNPNANHSCGCGKSFSI
jgi:iron-sulfur cluster assembly accessory protein